MTTATIVIDEFDKANICEQPWGGNYRAPGEERARSDVVRTGGVKCDGPGDQFALTRARSRLCRRFVRTEKAIYEDMEIEADAVIGAGN